MRQIVMAMAALVLLGEVSHAQAPTKVSVLFTPAFDMVSAFTAKERGFFEKRGLDVQFERAANGSVIMASLVSGTAQVGTPTIPIVLQANESGIEPAIIAGVSILGETAAKTFRIVNRQGFEPSQPTDYVGKKVAVPGIGGTLHILFVEWLRRNNVDPAKVSIVEIAFPSMPDAVKSSTVDAVVAVQPFVSRTAQVSGGSIGYSLSKDFPKSMPAVVYATTRDWAEKNPQAARAFREAIAEAVDYIHKNGETMRQDANKYLNLPPPVIANLDVPDLDVNVNPAGIAEWSKIMVIQGGIKKDIADPARLIFK